MTPGDDVLNIERLRLLASAALRGPAECAPRVEAAPGALFETHLASPRGRIVLFRRLDRQLRSLPRLPAGERAGRRIRTFGLCPDEACAIAVCEAPGSLRSAG